MKCTLLSEDTIVPAEKGFIVEGEEVYLWKPSRVDDILFCVDGLKGIDPSAIRLYVMHTAPRGEDSDPERVAVRGFIESGSYINYQFHASPLTLFITIKTSACKTAPILTFTYQSLPARSIHPTLDDLL